MLIIPYVLMAAAALLSGRIRSLKGWNARGLSLCIFGLLVLMIYVRTGVPDFDNYAEAYRVVGLGKLYRSLGWGWYALMLAGNALGISFRLFKTLICAFSFGLMAWNLSRFVPEPKERLFAWGLYLIFPALLDCVQMRYLLAESLILTAVSYLQRFSWKNLCGFLLFVTLAWSVHATAPLFYGLAVVWLLNRNEKAGTWLLTIAVVLEAAFIPFIPKLALLLPASRRIVVYLQQGTPMGGLGLLITAVLQTGLYWMCRKMDRNWCGSEKTGRFLKLCMYLTLAGFVIVPLCRVDANFVRLLRYEWILCYAAAAAWLNHPLDQKEELRPFGLPLGWYVLILAAAANLHLISLFTFEIVSSFLL